jgi:hypothetical protein
VATEFSRGLKPITSVFKADARPEVYVSDAPTEDERYYVPFTETVGSRSLWISPTQNRWCTSSAPRVFDVFDYIASPAPITSTPCFAD